MAPLSAPELHAALEAHWAPRGDLERITRELERRGKPREALSLEDLAAHDQLHAGGLEATREFASWVDPAPGARVLDLGAGLGGSARLLALEHGARVTAVELSAALSEAGRALTRWLDLEGRVDHRCAEGCALLPAEAAHAWDLIWLQHVDMHVPDKDRLYASCRARLRPDGRVVWHDWLAGPGGPPRWPVPWSSDGQLSFLVDEARYRDRLAAADLELTRFVPLVERTVSWYEKLRTGLDRALERLEGRGRPVPPHLPRLREEVATLLQNLEQERVVPFFGEAVPR
jgi:SAM-dependent methyltransferase